MTDPWQHYRDALRAHVHGVCLDRQLSCEDPDTCRMAAWIPALVELVREVGGASGPAYEAAVRARICSRCEHRRADDACEVRSRADCCLDRYLPLIVETIRLVDQRDERRTSHE
ncbi:MAG TPA: hypothetical protein VGB20_04840 [bacterium]